MNINETTDKSKPDMFTDLGRRLATQRDDLNELINDHAALERRHMALDKAVSAAVTVGAVYLLWRCVYAAFSSPPRPEFYMLQADGSTMRIVSVEDL
jgi:hypothetical protein